MSHADTNVPDQESVTGASPATPVRTLRIWPGLVLVGLFWILFVAVGQAGLPISTTFMSRAGAGALLTLLFPIWWLTNRTVPLSDRFLAFIALIAGAVAAATASRETLGVVFVLFMGLPIVFTAWAMALLVVRRWPAARRACLLLSIALPWVYVSLLRLEGVTGDLKADLHWRWSPSKEDAYLAERSRAESAISTPSTESDEPSLELEPGDWPAFRGAERNGKASAAQLATDWDAVAPKLLWRQRIGPAWSSIVVVAGRLFTQEQVGQREVVVCLDASTGRRIWSHEDESRFAESQGGPGPRATPTFSDGLLFTQGAKGILNCLDAATGRRKWSHDVAADAHAPLPMWGFSGSPLVVDDLVLTYAGGPEAKGLLAYRVADGQLAWTAATGPASYCSPQRATFAGQQQVLFVSDAGLVALEPLSGKILWHYDAAAPGMWRVVQPAVMDDNSVVLGSEDLGLIRLDVRFQDGRWKVDERWKANVMKPGYNDFVVLDDAAYGFEGSVFCCVDLATGKRRWKRGRYGHGQVLLLADQRLLLVISEQGEVVLLKASPEAHQELGRFKAIDGKTWNHPVVAHGRLFVRNGEEMACYELPREETEARSQNSEGRSRKEDSDS